MGNIFNILMAIANFLGKFSVDIETTADGKIKLCITIDPKDFKE